MGGRFSGSPVKETDALVVFKSDDARDEDGNEDDT